MAQAAVFISFVLFLSKFIGFARDILVAKYFGATGLTDAFLVALVIPLTILGLFGTGLNTLIIPVYMEKNGSDPRAARTFADSVFMVATACFFAISALVAVFAPACVRVFAYGFTGERFATAVHLTRYLALSGVFTVLTGLLTGLLQAEKQFLAPALAGLAGNVAVVLSLYFLTPRLGINSWTLGQIVLAVLNFALLFLLLIRRYGFFRSLDWRSIDWRSMGRFAYLLMPLVVSSGVGFINTIVDKTVASGLSAGSIAAISFSSRVWGIPISLLATPIAVAVFPTLSELAVSDLDRPEFSAKLTRTMGITFFFVIPSSVVMLCLAAPIVRLLFERGAFVPGATDLTAAVTRMYVIALAAHAAAPVLAKVFYSFKNTMTPLIISGSGVVLNIILNIVLSRIMGAPGIALATTIVMTLNCLFYVIFLRRYVNVFNRPLVHESLKLLAAAIPMAPICLLARPLFAGAVASTMAGFFSLLLRLGLTTLAAGAAFLGACALLKTESLAFAWGWGKGILSRVKENGPQTRNSRG